jgi:hypothetical protein
MKRPIFALVAGVAAGMIWISADRVGAQATTTPSAGSQSGSQGSMPSSQSGASQSSAQKAPSVTLTGCLTQGSSSSVFILDNARTNPSDRSEKGQSYIVSATASSVDLKAQLNHEVRVTGQADEKVASDAPAGGKIDEKDMPKLQAASLVSVASSCQAG